jgi:predicted kinase
MLSFKSFLAEGVHDPAKLKAIFIAGGPGSGKSHVVKHVRGDLGFKMVNSDDAFEHGMKRHGLDPKMPEHETEKRDAVRKQAKNITAKKSHLYQHGRLGMVIDGTGKDFHEIHKKSEHLKSLGYDTHMLFVNTSLDVAHKRNKKRARTVPDHIVDKSWHQVHNNMGKFQDHFGKDNFHVIDNSHDGVDHDAINKLHKHIRKIASSQVKNPVGKDWIRRQQKSIAKGEHKPLNMPKKQKTE